jgi:hypothetical protein
MAEELKFRHSGAAQRAEPGYEMGNPSEPYQRRALHPSRTGLPLSFDRQNLQPFGPEIWIADGPVASFYGFPYSTRMAVIRLSDGSLFIWSPVALSTVLRAAVDALGPVRHLVSPNALHHLFLAEWASAYPEARLYASPRLRRKRRDLSFDAELGDAPEPAWAGDIDQVALHGKLCAHRDRVFPPSEPYGAVCGSDPEFSARLVQGVAWRRGPARRNSRSPSQCAERLAFEFRQPTGSARGTCTRARVADRAGGDRPRRAAAGGWRRLRAGRFHLAAQA